MKNLKDSEWEDCYRLAVSWDNYDVSDCLFMKGYRVVKSENLLKDILYYTDREMFEKIEYMVSCGFELTSEMMLMILTEYDEYHYYHQDDRFLLNMLNLFRRVDYGN